jgi:hypothetical protein
MKGKSTAIEDALKSTNLPFTLRVLNFPLPPKFKVPPVSLYDGTTDHMAHLEQFRAHVALRGVPDEIACKAFPLTLTGTAREWFASIPPNTIDNFTDLAKHFLANFMSTHRRKMPISYLMTVQQKDSESLKDYVDRFQKERLTVVATPGNIVLMALMNGIHPQNPLALEVARKPPADLQEFMERAVEFINGEESIRALTATRQAGTVTSKKEPSATSLLPKKGLFGKKGEKGKQATTRELNLTPLNIGLVDILREVMTIPEARYPTPMRAPPEKRSMNKYCEYHRDHGHDTEDCIFLKIEIERLIRNGKLARFVVDQGRPTTVTSGQRGPGGRRPQPWPRGRDGRAQGPRGDQDRGHLARGPDIVCSPRRNANRERELREDLPHEDDESDEDQPYPLAVRRDEGCQEVKRRRHLENRLVIHNRAI